MIISTATTFIALKGLGIVRWLLRYGSVGILATVIYASSSIASATPATESLTEHGMDRGPVISILKPERDRGKGFKMVYSVDASLDVFWRYRTHFDNPLLLSNKFIVSHRLVSREANIVITETEYSNKPNTTFRWQTTVFPEQKLLRYVLLNPQECGQKYHYGYIQLDPQAFGTHVTQVAYFDFFGVSVWMNYPFKGGVSRFLQYSARWEQQFISEYKHQYME